MSEKKPLPEALRAEILKLATEGDSTKEGALTADVLLRIMRVAKTGRDLLVSLEVSPSNLAGMVKRPRWGNAIPMVGEATPEFEEDSPLSVTPYAPSPPAENFGMTALREIIAVAKNLNGGGTSPSKLVEALAIAREKGLDDVAQELERQLGVQKDLPVAVPVAALEGDPS